MVNRAYRGAWGGANHRSQLKSFVDGTAAYIERAVIANAFNSLSVGGAALFCWLL
jgi:predicted homoserine dehydrogenase-like protein